MLAGSIIRGAVAPFLLSSLGVYFGTLRARRRRPRSCRRRRLECVGVGRSAICTLREVKRPLAIALSARPHDHDALALRQGLASLLAFGDGGGTLNRAVIEILSAMISPAVDGGVGHPLK